MDYFLMPLTAEESKNPENKGFAYALSNKSRWVNINEVKDEFNTYDKGTTVLIYANKVYNVFKDYVNVTEKYRIYIGCDLDASYDDISDPSINQEDYWSSTNMNEKVQGTKFVRKGESIQNIIDKSNNRSPIKIVVSAGTYPDSLTIDDSKDVTIIGPMKTVSAMLSPSRCSETTSDKEAVISGDITIGKASKITFIGLTFTEKANINVTEKTSEIILTNNRFVGLTNGTESAVVIPKLSKLTITENYFGKSATSLNCMTIAPLNNSTILRNFFADGCCTDSNINITEVSHDASSKIMINNNHAFKNTLSLIKLEGKIYNDAYFELVHNTFGTIEDSSSIVLIKNDTSEDYTNTSIKLYNHSIDSKLCCKVTDITKPHPIVLIDDVIFINSK
jgi:hypothetical protein